jgi:hypothetical protein
MTTPQCTLTCVAHSRFPKRFHHPVWRFRFLLPAFDPRLPGARRGEGLSPVHQGGRSFLRYRLLFTVSLTCMDMQLRKSNDPSINSGRAFRRPSPIFADGFGRTGRTHCLQRTKAGWFSAFGWDSHSGFFGLFGFVRLIPLLPVKPAISQPLANDMFFEGKKIDYGNKRS